MILPPAPASGPDGPYPLIGDFHGWGGSKIGIDAQTQGWAENGYAVFSMSDRGWGNSCGGTDPTSHAEPECAAGYNHLMDDRYEVRDAQYLIAVLADEGVAQPQKIGATGVSYGGGISMALAALRDRDDAARRLARPVEKPGGTPMPIAAAVPHALDRPRLLADAERQHARLRRRLALPQRGRDRGREAVLRRRPLRAGAGDEQLRAAGHRSRAPT